MTGGITPSSSIGSVNSSVVVDFRRQDYFDEAKRGSIVGEVMQEKNSIRSSLRQFEQSL